MNKLIPLAGIVAVIAFFLSSCLFVVDQRQFALVFALGEIKRVVDQPGLYFKLPQPLQIAFPLQSLFAPTPYDEKPSL